MSTHGNLQLQRHGVCQSLFARLSISGTTPKNQETESPKQVKTLATGFKFAEGMIHIPERPSSLVFGGNEKRILFVTGRTGLYSVKIN